MILEKFRIQNFRPFYGQTKWFKLSKPGPQNVTVIHCENGVGKTSILNSLTWVFYEKLTDDLQERNNLVNKQAIMEASVGDIVETCVEIYFEHIGKKYWLKRSIKVKKTDVDGSWTQVSSEAILQATSDRLTWSEVKNYKDEIGRILPEKLHNYFFFNGERIDWMQREVNRKDFIDATTLLIGEETYNRSIRHLSTVKQRFEKEQQNIGDEQTISLYNEKTSLEKERDEAKRRLEDHQKNIEGYKNALKEISNKLIAAGGEVSALEEKRKALENERDITVDLIEDNRKRLMGLLSRRGYQAFSIGAINDFLGQISKLKDSGQIPSPYKRTFVKSLLDSKKCICDRDLIPGEEPYVKVNKWLEKASMSDIEEMAIRMEGAIEEERRQVPLFYQDVDVEQTKRAELIARRDELIADIEEIGIQLENSDIDYVRDLERQQEDLKDSLQESSVLMWENTRIHKEKTDEIEKLEKKILELEAKSLEEKLIKRRLTATKNAIDEVGYRREEMRKVFRAELERVINEIFRQISFKDYSVRLAEDYTLTLISENGTVANSTAESQTMSLSFILALMEKTRQYTASNDLIAPNSSVYPLVMDSPFGSLGEHYQKNVSKALPQISSQVLILVTKTQWTENVEKSIMPHLGKEYVISYFTPKAIDEEVSISIGGTSYPLVKQTAEERAYIKIEELTRHG